MLEVKRNPHAGCPFTDSDSAIEAALTEVSIPALLCSMVHITGDSAWIRSKLRPHGLTLNEYQGGMTESDMTLARRLALPAIAKYRDGGCIPGPLPPREIVHDMMSFVAGCRVADEVAPMFIEDLNLDGSDARAIDWGPGADVDSRADSQVVVIGCGPAGLLAGIRLSQAGVPFTIIDQNDGPGGTWKENHYPGARVDIGGRFYCYSFDPPDQWGEYFPQHTELRSHFERLLRTHDLESHCRFRTRVDAAEFNARTSRWTVSITNSGGRVEHLDARFVISAVGALNTPRLPHIDGAETFAGPSFHSNQWDSSIDYSGMRFALVGAGASGFQIAAQLADEVAQLNIYQRTAQWMLPSPHYRQALPPGDRWAARHLPFYGRWFRFLTFYPGSGQSMEDFRIDPAYSDGGLAVNPTNRGMRDALVDYMLSQLDDDRELQAKVIPGYPAMGKRILADDGSWLRCLRKDNVVLERTGIQRIVPDGVITTDGRFRAADIVCYATGFRHNDYLWPMRIIGRDGINLREQWGDEPTAYLGITVKNFPNFFCLYGPGTNLAHGANIIFQAECQVHYVLEAIREVLSSNNKTLEPRADVHDEYAQRYQSEISQMVWAHPSVRHSHFKNREGRIFTLSPWPVPTYWRWTKTFRRADYLWG
jgi:4-hydroxyacetophenone monooxygenase